MIFFVTIALSIWTPTALGSDAAIQNLLQSPKGKLTATAYSLLADEVNQEIEYY